MHTPPLTLQEINNYDRAHFVMALAAVFEGQPWIVEQAWSQHPFGSWDRLYQVLCSVMYTASLSQQIALLQAHPDLVGRAALSGTLSMASTGEQAAAGLDHLTPAEVATFQAFNYDYQTKFGFPFVICARANKKESILNGFATRLQHTCEQEIPIALHEVAQICHFRLLDIIRV